MSITTSADGTQIAYEATGEGPTVVIVDGAFVYRAIDQFPVELAGLLAGDFTVAHYERRGRGASGDTAPYAVEREIEDLRAVIAAVGGPAYVLGLSSGSVLALHAAAQGADIAGLMMYEPPVVVDDTRAAIPDDYVAQLDELIAEGRRGDAMEHAFTTAVGLPVEMVRAMRQEPFFGAMEAIAHTAAYDGRIMAGLMAGRSLPFDRWSSVTAPILVLVGEKGEPFFQSGTRALAEGLPTATHRSFDTRAEESHDVKPAALAPIVADFVTQERVTKVEPPRCEVRWDGVLAGSPAQVWDAITVHPGGWLWNIYYEPWVGGTEKGLSFRGGTVTEWEPEHRFVTRSEEDAGHNQLSYVLTPQGDGTHVSFLHEGVLPDPYDVQLDACEQHTAFYYHSLCEYVAHFAGRDSVYVTADAPESSAKGGFVRLCRALGIPDGAAVGDHVTLTVPGQNPIEGVVDYATGPFLGVRTSDALYRVYGRDLWGWPVGVAHHLFDESAERAAHEASWTSLLTEVFADEEVA